MKTLACIVWLAMSCVAAPPLFFAQNGDVDTAFSPDDLPNLALWLDADDASTLTLSGSVVDEWRDKSGNGRHFTGSGSARPALVSAAYNGRDAIQFDGVDDLLTCASAIASGQPVTIYTVARSTQVGGTSRSYVYDGRIVNSNRCLLALRANNVGTGVAIWSGGWLQRTEAYSSSWRAFASVYNGASSLLEYDGSTTAGNAGSFDLANGMVLGANFTSSSDFLTGDICEVVIYHAAHDAATRAQVEAYLTR